MNRHLNKKIELGNLSAADFACIQELAVSSHTEKKISCAQKRNLVHTEAPYTATQCSGFSVIQRRWVS